MNKILLWLASKQVPKFTRYILAALGAWLAKIGFEGDLDGASILSVVSGLALFGFAALWSVVQKMPGFDNFDKLLNALDLNDRIAMRLWFESLLKKGIAALFVWLGTKTGGAIDPTMTTEGAIGLLLTWALSRSATPDPVEKTPEVIPVLKHK